MTKINILIVEDNEDHLHFIKKALSDDLYTLQVIKNGKEAYNYLLKPKIKPDVVLLENYLPEMTGLEILEKLGNKKEDYGFVITAINTDTDIIVNALNAGASDFLSITPNYFYAIPKKIEKAYNFYQSKLKNKQTKASFKSIMESGEDDIWSIDTNYKITAFNQSFKHGIIGLTTKPIKIGGDILKIFPKNNIDFWKPKYDKALKGEKLKFEYSNVNDKLLRCYDIRLNPIIIDDAIVGLSAVGRDITERKKIENDLFTKNQSLEKHLNQTPLAAIFVDTNMIIKEWNLSAEKVFGYTTQEVLGKNLFKLVVSKEILSEIKSVRQNLLNEISGTHYQNKNKTKGGKEIICNWFSSIIKDENNNIIGIACLVEDITERKESELAIAENKKQLEETNFFLKESQNMSLLGYYTYNFQTKRWESSKMMSNLMGLKSNEGSLQQWIDIIIPADKHILTDVLKKRLKQPDYPLAVTYRVKSKGNIHWIHHTAQPPQKDKIGQYLPVMGVLQDITESKKAEEKLKQSENQFSMLMEQSPSVIELYNLDGLQIKVNKAYEILWGFKASTTVNKFNVLKSEEVKNTGLIDYVNRAYNGESVIVPEYQFNPTGTTESQGFGRVRWLATNIYPLKDVKGKVTNIVISHNDITERKLNEEKLKQSDAILKRIDSLVFVSGLRGDMQYVSPNVEKLLGYKPSELLGQKWWQKTVFDKSIVKKRQNILDKFILEDAAIKNQLATRKVKTKSGKFKWIEWHVSKGVGETCISVGIDVTEKQNMELRFEAVIKTAPNAIVLANDKGEIIEWNKAAVNMFGYSKEEVYKKPLTLIIPKKYQADHSKKFKEANIRGTLSNKSPIKKEGITNKGKIFPIEIMLSTWKSNNHNIYCAFIKDITQIQQAEKTKQVIYNITKKANTTPSLKVFFNFIKIELAQLIDTTNFFIALYNENTGIISTPFMVDEQDNENDFPKRKTLTGYIIDTKKTLLVNQTIFKRLAKTKKIKGLRPSSACWLGVPLLVKGKAIGAIVVQSYTDENAYTMEDAALMELIATNISQVIKQSHDYEQISLLSHALIQSDEAVIITDTDGKILYVNPAFTKLSGYTEKEALGQNPRILKSGNQHIEFYEKLWNTILKGKIWTGELVNKHKDGNQFLVYTKISPIKNNEGKITHFIGVQEDITKKRKLEHDFVHAFIDAQEQEKIQFGEDLHDGISQILSAESMYIGLLLNKTKEKDEQTIKFLNKINELNNNAIHDTRAIAHGLMSKPLKKYGLIIAVKKICEDYNQSDKIDFNFKLNNLKESEILKEVKINVYRIVQEVTTNTIRHSGATKVKVILSKTDSNNLKLIIKDNGIGFDTKKLLAEKKGAGLKNIERRVKLLNGQIKVASAPKKGVKYIIKIPLSAML